MIKKYIPSGAFSFTGILKTVLFGILGCILLPLLYVLVNHWIPNIWFAAISAVMFGLGLGFFIDLGIGLGKIRNIKVAAVIGVFYGLLAYYMQWIFFDEFMYNTNGFSLNRDQEGFTALLENIFFLFTHPQALVEEIVALNEAGTFRVEGSSTVSGAVLWALWVGEFAVILISVVLAVMFGKASEPFSEQNDAWMVRRKPFAKIPYIESKDELIETLDAGDLSLLKQPMENIDSTNFAEVIVFESNGDPVKYITVVNTSVVRQKLGKDNIRKDVLIKYYPITDPSF
ncbi:hypothetical protein [Sphingobacterium paucimobilis]|uniref:Uncharacterized protein n=1 Tax=Sphingobacterium paucimobilis HER1398 TaxID=1346330 RepID=U2JFC6_9SPHI|nr:hypothetical protein [Sphingobacterium paucimobilis]ERJ61383.1 hypothetical protein M472_21745 [Sphingobacterium paucimobilis HER1398]